MNAGSVGEAARVLRIQLDGGAVVVERRAVLFHAPISVGAVVVSLSVLWVEPQRLAVVVDRLLILAEIEIRIAAVEISLRKLGMGFDDFVIFDQRFFDLARLVQLQRGLERLFDLSGSESGRD